MSLHPQAKSTILTGSALLALAVLIGAFGAHGLKSLVTEAKLMTFETGVRYHFYHAIGLALVGIIQQLVPSADTRVPFVAFLLGILLFSVNCYLYVLLDMKIFAMIVPLGGISFVVGWLGLVWAVKRSKD
jgi:uncharacterized membrane protein YgdD (TMEM256/DUF423 family)